MISDNNIAKWQRWAIASTAQHDQHNGELYCTNFGLLAQTYVIHLGPAQVRIYVKAQLPHDVHNTNPTFVIWSWFTAKDDGITGRIMSLYLKENFLAPYKALLTRFFSLSCPRMHSQSSLVFDTASSLVISLSFNRWHFAAWSASSGSLILEHISSNDLETDSVSTTNVQSSSSKLVWSD